MLLKLVKMLPSDKRGKWQDVSRALMSACLVAKAPYSLLAGRGNTWVIDIQQLPSEQRVWASDGKLLCSCAFSTARSLPATPASLQSAAACRNESICCCSDRPDFMLATTNDPADDPAMGVVASTKPMIASAWYTPRWYGSRNPPPEKPSVSCLCCQACRGVIAGTAASTGAAEAWMSRSWSSTTVCEAEKQGSSRCMQLLAFRPDAVLLVVLLLPYRPAQCCSQQA